MKAWFLRALGAEVDEIDAVAAWSLHWTMGRWGWAAGGLLVILVLVAWWSYRRSPQELRRPRRALLTTLRVAFFALLVALLLQPVAVLTLEREVPRTLPILLDTTGSMAIKDGGATSRLARVTETMAGVEGRRMMTQLEESLEVPLLTFADDGTVPLDGGPEDLQATGDATALGDALAKGLERFRGASLAGLVVVSDGGQNEGLPVAEAGDLLAAAGVPVFAIGVGATDARDVALERVEVREVLLADDAAPVSVTLRAQGMEGESGRVVFSLGGVEVAEEPVTFAGDGPVEVRTLIVPKRPGEYTLEARFEADRGEEALARNNDGRAALRVVDRRLRVLLVDQAPRWEYKYLEAMLLRERRIDLSCHLFEADPGIAPGTHSPYLDRFPSRAEDLFDFDLVILGDVAPRFLDEVRQVLLRDYVARAGGALVVVAGKRFLPAAYQRSELARLLPVELGGGSITAEAVASRPARLTLTGAGEASVMLQLGDDPAASAELWRRLPPLYWTARVARAKPAAEVLASWSDPAGGLEARPVVALQRYGAGEVLFVGTDNLWRWRRNEGERSHVTLWGQIIQRMAGQRLLSETPRARIQSDHRQYRQGDRVRVHARLFGRDWAPRRDEEIPAVLVAGDDPDRRREVVLRAVPGEDGHYRAEFAAGGPGNYRLALGNGEIATLDFTVRDASRELARASLNDGLLRELADRTGGGYLPLAEISRLPALLTNRSVRISSAREVALWSSPLVLALLLLLLTIEWIVRKVSELK